MKKQFGKFIQVVETPKGRVFYYSFKSSVGLYKAAHLCEAITKASWLDNDSVGVFPQYRKNNRYLVQFFVVFNTLEEYHKFELLWVEATHRADSVIATRFATDIKTFADKQHYKHLWTHDYKWLEQQAQNYIDSCVGGLGIPFVAHVKRTIWQCLENSGQNK